MGINFFNHLSLPHINNQIKSLTQSLRTGDTIKAIHTPIVLPLGTSNEIGGYARSLGLPFGPKRIAIDCDRLAGEHYPAMREFILARQVALFDKSSRCLHLPLAAIAVATATIASSILFPTSMLAMVTIPAIVALASAAKLAKKERENELYADLKAFLSCEKDEKREILLHFYEQSHHQKLIRNEEGEEENRLVRDQVKASFIKGIFSGYPTAINRFHQLAKHKFVPVKKIKFS